MQFDWILLSIRHKVTQLLYASVHSVIYNFHLGSEWPWYFHFVSTLFDWRSDNLENWNWFEVTSSVKEILEWELISCILGCSIHFYYSIRQDEVYALMLWQRLMLIKTFPGHQLCQFVKNYWRFVYHLCSHHQDLILIRWSLKCR
jgi:hypothetical protein